jgi:hypothetical protein
MLFKGGEESVGVTHMVTMNFVMSVVRSYASLAIPSV